MSFLAVRADGGGGGCGLLGSCPAGMVGFWMWIRGETLWDSPGVGELRLTVTLPEFDGFVVFKSGRRNDVFRRVAGGRDHHVCRDTNRNNHGFVHFLSDSSTHTAGEGRGCGRSGGGEGGCQLLACVSL